MVVSFYIACPMLEQSGYPWF